MHEQSEPVLSATHPPTQQLAQAATMLCPCCGQTHAQAALECPACGARPVGEPLVKPDILLPKLGPAMLAFGVVCLIVIGFLAFWLFSNNMKVGRVLLLAALGDGYKFTRDLLAADPKLPYYRIFAWDALRNAFFLSAGIVPLSLLGWRWAWRARRLAQQQPREFGGLKLAQVSLVLSVLLFVTFSAAGLSGIPGALERGRLRRKAATHVMALEHAAYLRDYYREYGTFPRETTDLARVTDAAVPRTDYWGNEFKYTPYGTVASRNNALGFSNFTLTSAGPDGEFGTGDDIVMIDGVIVDKPSETDLPASLLAPEKKPRK
jgi:hypothetical protein